MSAKRRQRDAVAKRDWPAARIRATREAARAAAAPRRRARLFLSPGSAKQTESTKAFSGESSWPEPYTCLQVEQHIQLVSLPSDDVAVAGARPLDAAPQHAMTQRWCPHCRLEFTARSPTDTACARCARNSQMSCVSCWHYDSGWHNGEWASSPTCAGAQNRRVDANLARRSLGLCGPGAQWASWKLPVASLKQTA